MPAETNTILCIWFSILHVLLFFSVLSFQSAKQHFVTQLVSRLSLCVAKLLCTPSYFFCWDSFALNLLIPRHTYSQVFGHTIASKSFLDFLLISSLRTQFFTCMDPNSLKTFYLLLPDLGQFRPKFQPDAVSHQAETRQLLKFRCHPICLSSELSNAQIHINLYLIFFCTTSELLVQQIKGLTTKQECKFYF